MNLPISQEIFDLLQKNKELLDAIEILINHANWKGLRGEKIHQVVVNLKKKNPFSLRFGDKYYIGIQ